ncbi:fluoride efflux transporter FluC [Nocardioides alcanivorans]|uniref:fluoride efflux transporter FluC n=1 Tax=Nocardioides alcanivorans TaxID=2897352 RepID=UPI001F30C5D8|nr:CrcB family protein [Nocardioides alcanivorans]
MTDDPRPITGVDPDVDLSVPDQRAESGNLWRVLAVVALGGMVGALARHGLEESWPTAAGGFPWATFTINVVGSGALGALMAWVFTRTVHPLTRPLLGTGLLGGFTTFSTYALEGHELVGDGHPAVAVGYLAVSVLLGVGAAYAGWSGVRRLLGVEAP